MILVAFKGDQGGIKKEGGAYEKLYHYYIIILCMSLDLSVTRHIQQICYQSPLHVTIICKKALFHFVEHLYISYSFKFSYFSVFICSSNLSSNFNLAYCYVESFFKRV